MDTIQKDRKMSAIRDAKAIITSSAEVVGETQFTRLALRAKVENFELQAIYFCASNPKNVQKFTHFSLTKDHQVLAREVAWEKDYMGCWEDRGDL
jgi:hypothetical protein